MIRNLLRNELDHLLADELRDVGKALDSVMLLPQHKEALLA